MVLIFCQLINKLLKRYINKIGLFTTKFTDAYGAILRILKNSSIYNLLSTHIILVM